MTSEETNTDKPAYDGPLEVRAYSMKRKEKDVLMLDPVLKKTAKGAWMATGMDDQGNKMSAILNKVKAEALLAAGVAKLAEEPQ